MKRSLALSLRSAWPALAGRETYPIGLQMSLEAMHLVQLHAHAGAPALLAATSLGYGCSLDDVLATPRRLKKLVRRALGDGAFRGRRVVTCMPSSQVKTVIVSYAVAADQPETEAIVRQLDGRVEGAAEDMVFDFIPVRQQGTDSTRREALVAIAAKGRVTGYLDALSSAGLDVTAIDIGPNALARVIRRIASCTGGNFENVLLINFGTLGSFVTVFWGRRLMLDRPIEFGERRLLARVKTAMTMPEALAKRLLLERGFVDVPGGAAWSEIGVALKEVLYPEFMALKAEVSKTLIYTASKTRGKTVDKIYLVGGVARYPGVADLLREELAIPTEVLDPFSIFPPGADAAVKRLAPHTGAAVAAGLALRGVPSSWPNSI